MSILWVSLTTISQKIPGSKPMKIKEVPQAPKIIPPMARRILRKMMYSCLSHNHILLT